MMPGRSIPYRDSVASHKCPVCSVVALQWPGAA